MLKKLLLTVVFIGVVVCVGLSQTTAPNIVLILADDVALMDFGVYGGEAKTPNIDRLAKWGILFTNHHASPMCAPSRAMLMTGMDSHLTGVPNLPIFLPPEYKEKPGYLGILNSEVTTLATHLKNRGYQTYATGKWHLGHTKESLPSKRGFDRTFILDASGADNWEKRPYLPTQDEVPWYEDGKEIELPDDFYSSQHLVDKMIEFMEENEDKSSPFFSYLSFQAVHIPVQAPRSFIEKYEGVYDMGWDKMREARFKKAKALGIVPAHAKLGDMLPVLQKWESKSEEEKKMLSKSMAVNAAMLEAMDYHIGRYMRFLEHTNKLDQTLFIITSDNGPEASDPSLVTGMDFWLSRVGYTREYETLGEEGSYVFIGPEFASAAAGPSAFFKFYAGEGGLRVPLIISGANLPQQKVESAFSFITDITPTVLDIVDQAQGNPKSSFPFTGKSLLPVIQDQDSLVYQAHEPVGMEAASQAALFKGNHKLVRNNPPYGDGIWRLYDLKQDPGETDNLAQSNPTLFAEMKTAYDTYKAEFGVRDMPEGYEAIKEIRNTYVRNLAAKVLPWLLLLIIGVFISRKLIRRKNSTS